MEMVFIHIGRGQEAVTEGNHRGLRVINVPASARVLSTREGWKLEVPGQTAFWLPPDVQVLQPWDSRPGKMKRRPAL